MYVQYLTLLALKFKFVCFRPEQYEIYFGIKNNTQKYIHKYVFGI